MAQRRNVNRRQFLRLSVAAGVGLAATACGSTEAPAPAATNPPPASPTPFPTAEIKEVATAAPAKKLGEAPMLAERVAAGQLPPLEERLPENPLVVAQRDAVGVYGGEIRMVHFDPTTFVSFYGMNSDRMLHYSDMDLQTIVPNIIESWEISEDGKTFTFKLRKGMMWSDGEPFTTEDVRFWWEDIQNNTEITPAVSWQWRFGGEKMKFTVIDEQTFSFTFAAPFGNFIAHLTRWHQPNVIVPSHYLKQYHAKYTDKAKLEALAKERSLEGWPQLFTDENAWSKGIWNGPPGVEKWPVLGPWRIAENPQEGLYIWERNPYYWKVDEDGNQLPYIDNLRCDYVQNTEAVKLKLVQKELDYIGPHDVTIAQYPFYKENEASGNYIVGDYLSCMTDRYTLFPQHVLAEDKVLEEIINHTNFVKALSVAINRDEIKESLFFGLAQMGQLGPMPMSKYYKEEYGTAWAQYDADQANQLLDEMGLDKRDGDGFRLRPDGQRLKFHIEHAGPRVGASTAQFSEMIVTYWREIGIEASVEEHQESLYSERLLNAQVHCGMWHADRCTDMLLHIEPNWYIPIANGGQGSASAKWVEWYNAADKSAEGLVAPPDWIQELYGYYDQMTATTDEDERVALGDKIFAKLAERPLAIGTVLESPAPIIFNKNLRNLPRPKVPIGWDSYGISTYHPEAFFYEGGKRA